jgi:molybdenum cofactor cytidylyltransferase
MAENETDFKWVALILAAGSSSRMGKPKQFLKIDGETLIRKTVNAALGAGPNETVIVAGLDHELIKNELHGLSLRVIVNPHSEMGMGSSLKFGVDFVMKTFSNFQAVVLMVCDQPLLTSTHLEKMISEHRVTKRPIVASYYSGRNGVPALFHRSMFEKLLTIKDQQGAKNIIEQNLSLVKSVDFPEGAIDLDTPEDLKNLKLGT